MQFASPQAVSAYAVRDDEEEDFVDPFADLKEGQDDELAKLKLLFSWTPPQPQLLGYSVH